MNLGFITTSRADFGIYLPLLKKIENSSEHRYFIFAGGMHTAEKFGYSYELIEAHGLSIDEKIDSLVEDDTAEGLCMSMSKTMAGYGKQWKKYKEVLDIVFILGDRFEMFAASSSLVPFNIPIAHIHGGETTLGAIDDKFRHALSAISDYHFTTNQEHAKKVVSIIGNGERVYDVGALGIDSMVNMNLFSNLEFEESFQFNLSEAFVLSTIHPETVDLENLKKIEAVLKVFDSLEEKVLCTLPNADTEGTVIRDALLDYERDNPSKIKCFENLGQKGYLTAMKNCSYMLGNTSSGIIEACSFNIPVVNVGDRQKGRLAGDNVVHTGYDLNDILKAVEKAKSFRGREFVNPYGKGDTANQIIEILEGINK